MKIKLTLDFPDDFEPNTYGCALVCPFSHWNYDRDDGYTCDLDCPFLYEDIAEIQKD